MELGHVGVHIWKATGSIDLLTCTLVRSSCRVRPSSFNWMHGVRLRCDAYLGACWFDKSAKLDLVFSSTSMELGYGWGAYLRASWYDRSAELDLVFSSGSMELGHVGIDFWEHAGSIDLLN